MSESSFANLWTRATGHRAPFPYQRRLAGGSWPDVVAIPTGMGKTAAVGLSWIYRRMTGCPHTPRRLVYCLPMRVLAEQTREEFTKWLSELGLFGLPGEGKISVSLIMGGADGLRDASWTRYPEEDAVLIGTQDMLLSRALMRGYGMSRYQWPVHFALLHNDAMWVFDEVQLMGPALATSTQLEAFRHRSPGARPSRSLWLSATLREEWLDTVDFRERVAGLERIEIGDDDRAAVGVRLNAVKRLHRADVVLDKESAKASAKEYVDSLADSVIANHRESEQTLIVLNRVERAQSLGRKLRSMQSEVPVLVAHARFRPAERTTINEALKAESGSPGRIVVATQAVEAGVDMSSRTLFTELAPWSSMVQRFGRCNRRGEHPEGADIFWIDITEDADEAPPYEDEDLAVSRRVLDGLDRAGLTELPPVSADRPLCQVLRWKDLVDLFDTDPDLSGFDIDIAPYIRDQGSPQVQVFWRFFEGRPSEDLAPRREELCPVSMGQIRGYLKKKGPKGDRHAWLWDPLLERWARKEQRSPIMPGSTLLLSSTNGGYDRFLGFLASSKAEVPVVGAETGADENDSYSGDRRSRSAHFVELVDHLKRVAGEMRRVAEALELEQSETQALETAALRHDIGKAHPAFQTALLDYGDDEVPSDTLWAKSPGRGQLRYRIEDDEDVQKRRFFRHELASMLSWLATPDADSDVDLIAYLIAAHHGKVRMGLRALPSEDQPPDGRLFARGVWNGDTLPPLTVNGIEVPETILRLDIMKLGRGDMGPSWTERTRRLLQDRGPFQLAWLEALIRIADWRASAAEDEIDD